MCARTPQLVRDRFPPLSSEGVAPQASVKTSLSPRKVSIPEEMGAAVKGTADDVRWQEAGKKLGEDGKKLSQLLLRTMSAKVADQDGSDRMQASSLGSPRETVG